MDIIPPALMVVHFMSILDLPFIYMRSFHIRQGRLRRSLNIVSAAASVFLMAFPPAALASPFSTATTLSVSGTPGGVKAADLNGDGYMDIVASNSGDDVVAVRLGTGGGSFGPVATYATDIRPYAVAIGDMNNDGHPDIITSNRTGNTISYLENNGDGTFAADSEETVGSDPVAIAISDLNRDGNLDIVVVNIGGGTVSVILGNGDGTFQAQSTYAVGNNPSNITIGNFNGDAYPDIAVGNSCAGCFIPYNSGNVSVLTNRLNGTFNAAVNYAATRGVTGIDSADVNGDGRLDLVVSRRNSNGIGVYLGNGDGTFGALTAFGAGTQPFGVTLADFTGDGVIDAAVANGGSSNVSVIPGFGNGTFDSATNYAVPTNVMFVTNADLNGDGKRDIVTAGTTATNVYILFDAAPPQITTVTPSKSVQHETASFTITGSGFAPDSVVKINGSSLATTFQSTTSLTAQMDTQHSMAAGAFPITISVPSLGTSSNSTTYTVTEAPGVPAPSGFFDEPAGPFGIVLNNGASITGSRTVQLKLTGGANVKRMAISSSADFHCTSQIPFATETSWDLCAIADGRFSASACPDGNYTLSARFFTEFGHTSPVVSANIRYEKGAIASAAATQTTLSSYRFGRTLKIGTTSEDVRMLQKYLNANNFTVAADGPGSNGHETTLFGRATVLALKRFQNAHADEILKLGNLSSGTGVFGDLTRAYVNAH